MTKQYNYLRRKRETQVYFNFWIYVCYLPGGREDRGNFDRGLENIAAFVSPRLQSYTTRTDSKPVNNFVNRELRQRRF